MERSISQVINLSSITTAYSQSQSGVLSLSVHGNLLPVEGMVDQAEVVGYGERKGFHVTL